MQKIDIENKDSAVIDNSIDGNESPKRSVVELIDSLDDEIFVQYDRYGRIEPKPKQKDEFIELIEELEQERKNKDAQEVAKPVMTDAPTPQHINIQNDSVIQNDAGIQTPQNDAVIQNGSQIDIQNGAEPNKDNDYGYGIYPYSSVIQTLQNDAEIQNESVIRCDENDAVIQNESVIQNKNEESPILKNNNRYVIYPYSSVIRYDGNDSVIQQGQAEPNKRILIYNENIPYSSDIQLSPRQAVILRRVAELVAEGEGGTPA